MKNYRSIILLNALFIVLLALLVAFSKFINFPTEALFLPPSSPNYPGAGLLTHAFQLLCYIPPIVCAFSFVLLKKIQPQNPNKNFIFYSALITLGFLVNAIYRIHIIFVYVGIPKLATIFIYAIIAFSYGKVFWKRIKTTPYFLLLASLGLLSIAITLDSLRINNISTFAEGVPKLFSGLNAALYFWLVCYQEVTCVISKHN